AVAICDATGLPAVADDTGLEVESLGGAPGVRSARYAGEHASYDDNVLKLLDALVELPDPEERRARFRTVALVRFPDGREVVASGEVDGMIALGPVGERGFGYDPVFVPDEGDGRTFAEMTNAEKHALSHRGRAFRAPSTRYIRSCFATVGSVCAATMRTRSPTAGRAAPSDGENVVCSSETNHTSPPS